MVEGDLRSRSKGICELCGGADGLTAFLVEPGNSTNPDQHVHACSICVEQITKNTMDSNHWRCLTDCMWSEVPAVQVLSWRMLHRLKAEDWPQYLIDMMYLNDETLTWAEASGDHREVEAAALHVDSNGTVLENGDTIVLIKDLEVKGAGFTAKRGTSVRNIRLVKDNTEQIEGKINGQGIVILTQYVKK
jgi:protein PhnA